VQSPTTTTKWLTTGGGWYIVSALKIIIYYNIIRFCLQTSEMHEKLNKI